MIALHKRERTASHPQAKEQLRRQIEAADRQIDQLVCELYGLGDKDIEIVESTVERASGAKARQ